MMRSTLPKLPVSRPLLPKAPSIRPFLEEIDSNRWYTNFGPLLRRFESKLGVLASAPQDTVVTASSATTAITLALRDLELEPGYCLLPSWTFIATPIAVRNAGLTPFFVDVDRHSWQLTPATAHAALRTNKDKVRAVVVVAPFSAAVDAAAWGAFMEDTGIPVVVDAASAFDLTRAHAELATIVSLHATKALGIGEGAFILAGTPQKAERLRRMSNFGMNATRLSFLPGENAKLSEFAAAVGLAALDEWPQRRATLIDNGRALRNEIENATSYECFGNPGVASSTFNIVTDNCADELIAWLNDGGVEARKWWVDGCHTHPAFSRCPRGELETTENLARQVVGLPFFPDMTMEDIERIAEALRSFHTNCTREPVGRSDAMRKTRQVGR